MEESIEFIQKYSANNYDPLPVIISEAQGVWMEDIHGKRYLDMLSAYSALNFGHRHPELIDVAIKQMQKLTLTSRAFHNDNLGLFCKELADLCGMDLVLPMNTGAEAVETAIKTARKWGYAHKNVPINKAKIIVCEGNFHGRTTTIISFSTDDTARSGYEPFTPGFEIIPYGDSDALVDICEKEGDHIVAFLVEPIQGENGVIIPPEGYLKDIRKICDRYNILFIADEVQSGLGRTAKTFACDWENVKPDMYILGKALGGGIMPVSAVVSKEGILSVFKPGEHGSTFGGNPLGVAIGRKVISLIKSGELQNHAQQVGSYFSNSLKTKKMNVVQEIRSRGLWMGIQIKSSAGPAKFFCKRLMQKGILCKESHEQVIRLSPPLIITTEEIDIAIEKIVDVLST